jgi:hypothetical protein
MIVVRVRPDFSFEVIDREKAMVRLGAGGLDGSSSSLTAQPNRERASAMSATRIDPMTHLRVCESFRS